MGGERRGQGVGNKAVLHNCDRVATPASFSERFKKAAEEKLKRGTVRQSMRPGQSASWAKQMC